MKRLIRLTGRFAGDTLPHTSAAATALLFAAIRGLRLLPDELPAQMIGTINLLEWAAGCLGLIVIFSSKYYPRTERDHE